MSWEKEVKDIKNKRKGKPRKVNSKRKKIVEMYGMKIATEYLESQGWKVDDTSTGTFDLTASFCGRASITHYYRSTCDY